MRDRGYGQSYSRKFWKQRRSFMIQNITREDIIDEKALQPRVRYLGAER